VDVVAPDSDRERLEVCVSTFQGEAQAARRFGVHCRFIYKKIAERHLPAIKLGAPGSCGPVIRIPLEALERWESAQLEREQQSA
jgi:excisionase family DNA binding protein